MSDDSTVPDPDTAPGSDVRALLVESFTRVRDLVVELTSDTTAAVLTYRPDAEANTIAWLIWHLSRVQDDHVADLAHVGQAWPAWRERFGLPFDPDETGWSQSPGEVGEVQVDAALLAGYHADVHALTLRYLETVDEAELHRIVDTRWDPPVTAMARIVSVLGDTLQHLGQAGYVRGLAERAGTAR